MQVIILRRWQILELEDAKHLSRTQGTRVLCVLRCFFCTYSSSRKWHLLTPYTTSLASLHFVHKIFIDGRVALLRQIKIFFCSFGCISIEMRMWMQCLCECAVLCIPIRVFSFQYTYSCALALTVSVSVPSFSGMKKGKRWMNTNSGINI